MFSHRTVLLSLTFSASVLTAQEICTNAVDDDADGLIDLNDPDCVCGSVNAGVPSLLPNPSFEERQTSPTTGEACCPMSHVSPVSVPWFTCAVGWMQPTEGTTDYMHACHFRPDFVPLPLPDGDACVGGFGWDDYMEMLGNEPGPDMTPLIAGQSYTLEMQVAAISMDGYATASAGQYYAGPWTLSVYGRAVPEALPLETYGCLLEQDGWVELGSVTAHLAETWQPVQITFTPPADMGQVIIGPGCDLPDDFVEALLPDPNNPGDSIEYNPYMLYDQLLLNTSDLFAPGATRSGAWCTDDVVLHSGDIPNATDGQWFRNGVALVGQTGATLALSMLGLDGGAYSYTCSTPQGCVRNDVHVPLLPAFTVAPTSGDMPLEVTFTATTPGPAEWNFGDGTVATGQTVVHTYMEPGTFTVSLQQDVLSCATTTAVLGAVTVLSPELMIVATPQPTDITNTEITLSGHGPEGIEEWEWDLGDVAPNTAEGQQIVVEFPAVPGVYPVSLIATGDFRDEDSDTAYYTVVILETLGVEEQPDWTPLSVFPNPVLGGVHVDAGHIIDRWEVLNNLGQAVLQGRGPLAQLSFDSAPLRSGSYQLRIEGGGTVRVARFTK